MCITRIKGNTSINNFKNVNLPFLQGIRFNISRLHQRLLKSFKEAVISLGHLEKSILEGNPYLGPLEIILRTLASGMTFRLPVITCHAEGYK